jgi:ATP/maltotriose-dependent transcriptional regulator MalT
MAADLDHPMTLAYVATYAAILAAESEDLTRLDELLRDADLLRKRLSERYLMVALEALRGWLAVHEGSAESIEKVVRSVTRSRAEGETLHLTYTLLLLARSRVAVGDPHQGRAAAQEGLAWSHRYNQRYLEAELWRLNGELAYHDGDAETAAASLRRAVEVAGAQGAGWLKLRALHSFARRFPDERLREQLRELLQTLPSGHHLPPFRAATSLLIECR